MPELLPIYEQLIELAGCSQAVWPKTPLLVRNYDYSPHLFEGNLLYTNWRRPVIAMIDCLWGVLDSLNEAGLTVSLAFAGRKKVGQGFAIPLILRYSLEMCETTTEASQALRRVPVQTPYNVTVLDRAGQVITAQLGPDQTARISDAPLNSSRPAILLKIKLPWCSKNLRSRVGISWQALQVQVVLRCIRSRVVAKMQ
jgi:predicted choloylglycine hydrolase